jgi:hypothetical protein
MLALAELPHSGAVAVVRQLRRPSLKRRHELSCWGDFRPVASHSIGVEQP